MTDSQMIDWLEAQVRKSPTGISFDWIPALEGEPSGFRFHRKHLISDPKDSLRAAIEFAAELIAMSGRMQL